MERKEIIDLSKRALTVVEATVNPGCITYIYKGDWCVRPSQHELTYVAYLDKELSQSFVLFCFKWKGFQTRIYKFPLLQFEALLAQTIRDGKLELSPSTDKFNPLVLTLIHTLGDTAKHELQNILNTWREWKEQKEKV